MTWMIYGANGYTGELIAREAAARGLKPILAGRNIGKVSALANELGFKHRAFTLDDPKVVAEHLQGVRVVLLTAGPFSATAACMISACLMAGAHYVDITGEIDVFELAAAHDEQAKARGVVLCPGVGFDVIPTDCIAATLKEAMPDATELSLGFDTTISLSPGTLKTTIENMPDGGKVRRDGRIQSLPQARFTRRIDFGRGAKLAASMPLGDVSSAYHSTGIKNITVYLPATRIAIMAMRLGDALRPLTRLRVVQQLLFKLVSMTVTGPDQEARDGMPAFVWGEVVNAAGERLEARVETVNGYSFTVPGALAAVQKLIQTQPRPGYLTPSQLLGPEMSGLLSRGAKIQFG